MKSNANTLRLELKMIQMKFNEFNKLVTEFGLENPYSPLYEDMEGLLIKMRERYKDISNQLGIERV